MSRPPGAAPGRQEGHLSVKPGLRRALAHLRRLLLALRVEEAIALVFYLPTAYLTLVAERYAQSVGDVGNRYTGGVTRLIVVTVLLSTLGLARLVWGKTRWVSGARAVLPYVACLLIYTNLHDTIAFVNPHDIHPFLARLDARLFGVVPCVWAERFITPARTEVMSFLYADFFWIAPAVPILLLLMRRMADFRTTVLGIVTCFYLGYFAYVLFPAAPPRLYLAHEFSKSLRGYPNLVYRLSEQTLGLLPLDSRAAFPSLHAAASLLALVYAWRYTRPWFFVLVPFVGGLWLSTIYLRHHYVVDLFAGWLLVPLALWTAPRLERGWERLREAEAARPRP
jgi:membrane-associated phospholipid phosphatase